MILTSNNPEPKLELQTVKLDEQVEAERLIDEAIAVLQTVKTDLADGDFDAAQSRGNQCSRKLFAIDRLLDTVILNQPEED